MHIIHTTQGPCSASSAQPSTWYCSHLLLTAEHRTAAPLLLGALQCWPISAARTTLSSKPTARCCWGRMMEQTNGRTGSQPLNRLYSTYYVDSARSWSVDMTVTNNWHACHIRQENTQLKNTAFQHGFSITEHTTKSYPAKLQVNQM